MRFLFLLLILSSQALAGRVNVEWACDAAGADLPRREQISVEVTRSGKVKFRPDVFRANGNIQNFFGNLVSNRRSSQDAAYGPCFDRFRTSVLSAVADYRSRSCGNGRNDGLCTQGLDRITQNLDRRIRKSPYFVATAPAPNPRPQPPGLPENLIPPGFNTNSEERPAVEPEPRPEPGPAISPATNQRFFTLLGGGGEPAGATTIFDTGVREISVVTGNPNWQSSAVFNGGHSTTEALVNGSFSSPNTRFTPTTYAELIQDYLSKIQSGTIKPGDQVFLMIDSHGASGSPGSDAHSIATTANSDATGAGAGSVNLADLRRLITAAESKGVKLAIADLSCFSGLSQSLGTEKTCVISATGRLNFAAGGESPEIFTNRFIRGLTPGRNLEDVYLDARKSSVDYSFPEISTRPGQEVSSEVYPLLHRYHMIEMNTGTQVVRQLSSDLRNSYFANQCAEESQDVLRLEELARNIEDIVLKEKLLNVKAAVDRYQDYRNSIYRRLDALNANELRGSFRVCEPAVVTWTADGCDSYQNLNVLTNNWDALIANYTTGTFSTSANRAKAIAFYQKIKDEQQRLRTLNIDQAAIDATLNSVMSDSQRVYELAREVGSASRDYYDAAYRSQRTPQNPCRDFVL